MEKLRYIYVLSFIAVCAPFIALVFRIRVKNFWRTFLLTDSLVLLVYLTWDYWAISKRNWYFDDSQILGIFIFGKLPIEEVLFFIVVPLTSILTFLALKKLTKWR